MISIRSWIRNLLQNYSKRFGYFTNQKKRKKKIVSGFDTIVEDIIYTRKEKIVSGFRYFINNNKKRKIASGFDTIVKEMIDIQRDLNILFIKKKKKKKSKEKWV